MSKQEEWRPEVAEIFKSLERYKLPGDLSAEEKRLVELWDKRGLSEFDQSLRLQLIRESMESQGQENAQPTGPKKRWRHKQKQKNQDLEIARLLKRLEKYKLPDDLNEDEKEAVELWKKLGCSELVQSIKLRERRKTMEKQRQEHTRSAEQGERARSRPEKWEPEILRALKRVEKYFKMPDDLNEEEERLVELWHEMGLSLPEKVTELWAIRESREKERQENTRSVGEEETHKQKKWSPEVARILKQLEKYRLPNDLSEEEKEMVEAFHRMGLSEFEQSIRLQILREGMEKLRRENTRSV